ncbi:hypothetical protein WR25_00038 [Diploscapter pachys]|uniref:Uncharacterized protein n=1 Tax=Diploscapter pachys TaxID=2018661 RepID=A0A2A2KE08_9BILA|nr:hypothetical protein WR25_00038 [Diploscapter pachys]
MKNKSKSKSKSPLGNKTSDAKSGKSRPPTSKSKNSRSASQKNATKSSSNKFDRVPPSPNAVPSYTLADKLAEERDSFSSNSGPDWDVTQWEFTRFADDVNKGSKDENDEDLSIVNDDKGLLGEDRQVHVMRGEHLLKRPYILLALLGVETALCAVSIGVWSGAAKNPTAPMAVALVNLIICFLTLAVLTLTEMFVSHLLRVIFVCANITIMALDSDPDGGSIVVLAMQPLMLLLSLAQMYFLLRQRPTKAI